MDDELKFYQKPAARAIIVFASFIIGYFLWELISRWFYPPDSNPAFDVFWDFLLCGGGLVFWLVFFAQFSLPVKSIPDRIKIIDRLFNYLIGTHGPAIFISNGIVHESAGERKRKGPGVLWLDSASAAMLRTSVQFTKAIGPGVYFTKPDESIATTVDLHNMIQNIGPDENDEPFTPLEDKEKDKEVQERRWATSGITRDNIEVVPLIAVTFRINAQADEGGSRFGYNADNTGKLIIECITQGASLNDPVWSQLPAKMAADLWREYLRKFKQEQLFELAEGKTETNLQIIAGLIKARMQNETVDGMDDFGRLTGQKVNSLEYENLQKMGLRIINVVIKKLFLPKDVEDSMVTRWTPLWLKNAQKEKKRIETLLKETEERGIEDAKKRFAQDVAAELYKNEPQNETQALDMLIRATFKGVRREPNRTPSDLSNISFIRNWLRHNHKERGGS